jgi:hypothetical protein
MDTPLTFLAANTLASAVGVVPGIGAAFASAAGVAFGAIVGTLLSGTRSHTPSSSSSRSSTHTHSLVLPRHSWPYQASRCMQLCGVCDGGRLAVFPLCPLWPARVAQPQAGGQRRAAGARQPAACARGPQDHHPAASLPRGVFTAASLLAPFSSRQLLQRVAADPFCRVQFPARPLQRLGGCAAVDRAPECVWPRLGSDSRAAGAYAVGTFVGLVPASFVFCYMGALGKSAAADTAQDPTQVGWCICRQTGRLGSLPGDGDDVRASGPCRAWGF